MSLEAAPGPPASPSDLLLRYLPPDGSHEVPAHLLAESLAGLQGLVHVLAMGAEGRGARQRVRVPDEIAGRYVLLSSPPAPGSLTVSTRLGQTGPDTLDLGFAAPIMGRLEDFAISVRDGVVDKLRELLPDRLLRSKALAHMRRVIPPAGCGYRLEMNHGDTTCLLDDSAARNLQTLLRPAAPSQAIETVTGKLTGIEFDDCSLTLFYAPMSRELKCVYPRELEPMLFENRRDLIQVTGLVHKDADGYPAKIVDVEIIADLDLSQFRLDWVPLGAGHLALESPLFLTPQLSEEEQHLEVADAAFGIECFAPTRDALWQELLEQVAMLWVEYAEAPDENLSPPAQEVKTALLARMRFVPDES